MCVRPCVASGRGLVIATSAWCDSFEHVTRHADGELVLPHEDLAGILLAKQLGFLLAVRANDRLDARIERACRRDHLPSLEGIGDRDNQHPRPDYAGLDKLLRIRCIARDRLEALLSQLFDQLAVMFHHHEWQTPLHQGLADPTADPAEADEDDVARQLMHRCGGREYGQRIRPAPEPWGQTGDRKSTRLNS